MSTAMPYRSHAIAVITALASALSSLGPAMAGPKPAATVIRINGSSTLLPFSQAAIRAFAARAKGSGRAVQRAWNWDQRWVARVLQR